MRRVRLNNSLAQGNARGQRPGQGCLLYLCLDEAAFLTRTGLVRPVRLSAWHLGPSVRLPFSPISMCPDRLCERIFWMLDFTKMPAVTLHWDEFVLYPSQSPRPLPGTWVFFASLPISPFPLRRLLSFATSLLPDELFSALSSGSGRLTPVYTLSFPESNQTGVPVWSASTTQQVLGLMSQLTASWIITELETKTLNSGH